MSELTSAELDRIEARLNQHYRYDQNPDGSVTVRMPLADVTALVAALRAAWAERGRVVGVQKLRDVTLTTYERSSDEAQEPGGGG